MQSALLCKGVIWRDYIWNRVSVHKIHVVERRFWPCVLLADLNKALGNTIDAHEAAQMHQNFSQQLLQDHIAACSLPEHNLISVSETPCCVSLCLCDINVNYHLTLQCFIEFTSLHLFISVCQFCVTVFILFSSGLTALLPSRSKLRMAQPPVLRACYEEPPVSHMALAGTLSHATDWCPTTCYETTVAWKHFDKVWPFSLLASWLLVCNNILSCWKTNFDYSCTCIPHCLMAWMLTRHEGRVGLIIVVKDTVTYKRASLPKI